MTLNLKSLAFVPYVGLFSGICIAVLATFDHFHRRLIFNKRATCRPAAAGKNSSPERHVIDQKCVLFVDPCFATLLKMLTKSKSVPQCVKKKEFIYW